MRNVVKQRTGLKEANSWALINLASGFRIMSSVSFQSVFDVFFICQNNQFSIKKKKTHKTVFSSSGLLLQ